VVALVQERHQVDRTEFWQSQPGMNVASDLNALSKGESGDASLLAAVSRFQTA
jgi:hypothetical protein